MKIVLKSITLKNFKGGSTSIDFGDLITNIYGANEAGKTRIFDAFTWLLWAKDSIGSELGEKVKPLDENNNVIHKVTTSVEATLLLNTKTITLRRDYFEKWVKPRGASTEEMQGHTSEFFTDGVKVQKQDFDKAVNDICDEQTFKMLTNPAIFPSLHWEEQRKMLFSLAGHMEPYEICKEDKDLLGILDRMGTLKSKQYKDRLTVQKTEASKAIADIEPRIDELSSTMPEPQDWKSLEKEVEKLNKEIEALEEQRASVAKQDEQLNLAKSKINKEIYTLEDTLVQLRNKHKEDFFADFNTKLEEYAIAYQSYTAKEQKRTLDASAIELNKKNIEQFNEQLAKLRTQYVEIADRTFIEIPEESKICPSCGQLLPEDKITSMNEQALSDFNILKAGDLKKTEATANELKEKISKLESTTRILSEGLPKPFKPIEPTKPDYTPVDTTQILETTQQIAALTKERDEIKITENNTISASILELRKSRDLTLTKLSVKDTITKTNNRITELTEQLKSNAQRKADIEMEEDLLARYNKTMVNYMEEKVSGLFKFVKFKLFKTLINGGEEPTCELLIKGVPYSIANTAGRTQAGLDVISTLQLHSNTYTPVFIDNRDLVTKIPIMDCQVINLFVSPQDKEIRITHS